VKEPITIIDKRDRRNQYSPYINLSRGRDKTPTLLQNADADPDIVVDADANANADANTDADTGTDMDIDSFKEPHPKTKTIESIKNSKIKDKRNIVRQC
jgi:hypothetical protein